jgi:hypothetical protein
LSGVEIKKKGLLTGIRKYIKSLSMEIILENERGQNGTGDTH